MPEGLKKVKSNYSDVDDYISTFEPLLFEEVKAQIAQRKDEEEDSGITLFRIMIIFHLHNKRMIFHSLGWELSSLFRKFAVIECKHGVVVKCPESDGFYLPEVTYGSSFKDNSICQNDLILLSNEKVPQ